MLKKRELGKTGLQVPPIVLGGNVFGWTVPEGAAFHLLDRAFELGLNFIDTANVYSKWAPGNQGGESESILGKWFASGGKRHNVILATKVGWDLGEGNKGLRADYIHRAVEESLRRLQTDYIDIYFSHIDDPSTPLEETLAAYQRLIDAGKVRSLGASNYTGARLREAMEVSAQRSLPGYQVLQPLYNLLERQQYESDIRPVAEEFGLGVTPYYGLASGFLTGKYRSDSDLKDRPRAGNVKKYLNEKGLAVVHTLDAVARDYHSTPASVALAWLIQQPTITAAIASATNEQQLSDLAAAAELQLDLASIERIGSAGEQRLRAA